MHQGGVNSVLQRLKLSLKKRLELLQQTACGMHYLHTREPAIIHRDLKPENLLVDRTNKVVISDFGLSRLKSKTMGKTAYVSTWNYMPPEKMKSPEENNFESDEGVDEAGDVYSFAIIMFEVITLLPVFPLAKFPMQIANLVGRGERPKFLSFEEMIQSELADSTDERVYNTLVQITTKAWSQDPHSRPSFQELQIIIEQCMDQIA
jgi:serine/threonine protein kinase